MSGQASFAEAFLRLNAGLTGLNGKLEAAAVQQLGRISGMPSRSISRLNKSGPLIRVQAIRSASISGENHRPLKMPRQGGDQPIERAALQQRILTPERPDDLLADSAALAHALDQVE